MHFAKWIRKNSKKIMVFVVIFSMVSFVIGYTGLQLFFSFFGGDTQVIGIYDGGKVRIREYKQANNELQLLQMLGADSLLMAQGQQGLAGPLMVHLLFPDSRFASNMAAQFKQAAQSGQLPISIDKIEAFFNERTQPELTWLLLKAEAANTGSVVSDETSLQMLQQLLPQLAQGSGADAAQIINTIVSRAHVTEDQLVRTFAELLGVMFYVGNVTDSQTVTLKQIQAAIARSKEKFDAEFVRFPAEWYMTADSDIAPERLQEQFQAYKTVLPGTVTPDNPFGFGYKLPGRVQLQYMAVLLDDVKTQIERPSPEALEEYYTRNINQFRDEKPVDPNNPEGEKITLTRPFAEVLPQIRTDLEEERVSRLANQIFNDARTATEKGFSEVRVEEADVSELKAAAGDYTKAAEDLAGRYDIPVLTGKTGSLSPTDFAQDSILGRLRLQQGATFVPLSEIVFAARLDPKEVQRHIGVPIVRPWENIGPMTGGYYDEAAGKYHRLMIMVRITDINPETIPDTMDVTYDNTGAVLQPAGQAKAERSAFSLAEQVTEDVRLIQAMETAQARAERLAELVEEHGWDKGLEAFNTEYTVQKISLQKVSGQARMTQAEIERMRRYMAVNPVSAGFIQNRLETNALNEQLYTLLPEGEPTTPTLYEVLQVPQTEAAYVLKSVTRIPANETEFLEDKVNMGMQLNAAESMGLALVQLNPQNIIERMQYTPEEAPVTEAPDAAVSSEMEE